MQTEDEDLIETKLCTAQLCDIRTNPIEIFGNRFKFGYSSRKYVRTI